MGTENKNLSVDEYRQMRADELDGYFTFSVDGDVVLFGKRSELESYRSMYSSTCLVEIKPVSDDDVRLVYPYLFNNAHALVVDGNVIELGQPNELKKHEGLFGREKTVEIVPLLDSEDPG